MFANIGALHNLQHQYESGFSKQKIELNLLFEASRISAEMAAIQQQITVVLAQAQAGKLDEGDIYRIHSKVVDALADLTTRVEVLGIALDRHNHHQVGAALLSEFTNYRNYVLMATDIAAIEPRLAANYISQAQDRFISFSRQSDDISIALGEQVQATGDHASAEFTSVLQQNIVVISIGLLAMFGLVLLAIRRIAGRIATIADALNMLTGTPDDPPPLADVEKLLATHTGVFRELAVSVLSFRQALVDRREAEDSLQLSASVFTHAREGIIITDPAGNIVTVNQAFTDITGYTREEVLGQNSRILSSGRQDEDFYITLWQDLQTKGYWYGEIWNRRKDGSTFVQLETISAVRNKQGEIRNYISLFTDITALKEQQTLLEHIAHYDALTGLPNGLLKADRLRQAMSQINRRGQRLAVVYLDLDGFKAINDTHGHEMGDELLKIVAHRMKQALRDGDTLARIGGDEFVAVLVDLDNTEASLPILDRLLDAAAQPVAVGNIVMRVTASVGVSFYPQNEEVDADQLVRQADQAMYQAKQSGKNHYHLFDPECDRSVRGHHESLEHMRQALANHEFVLHYQPKVNMRTGELIGAEALIRWQHPQNGLLPPSAFLPLVENHPLAIELGEWVLTTAMAQIESWHANELTIPISVNVGALQLQHPNFVSCLRALLARHPRVQPGELELEVLETSALADFDVASQVMIACQNLGVDFALDDFGTGYSSLTYLKQLPTVLLKVDQSFVRNMLNDPDDLAILESVLGLAAAFRRQVIAEGVETLSHGEMLLHMGCAWGQGYAIARPMPAQDLEHWVATWEVPHSWQALKPVSRDLLPVLVATVAHRAWVNSVVDYLSGTRDTPPEQNVHQCRVGSWLDHGGRDLPFDGNADHPIVTLHQEIHHLAATLIELKRQGRDNEALARIPELLHLRDQLLERLTELF